MLRSFPLAMLLSLVLGSTALSQPVPTSKPQCGFPAPGSIACNQSRSGQLQFTDCYFYNNYQSHNYDYWTFSGTAGQYVEIYVEVDDFLTNPRVAAYAPNGSLSGVGSDYQFNSRTDLLVGTLPATGSWTIMVTTEDPIIGSKPYTLELGCSAPPDPTTPPAAPTGLAAAVLSTTEVGLTWMDNANNEDEYRVELRTVPSGQFVDIGGVPANSTAATISGLTPATSYAFRVRARRVTTNSAYSNEVTVTTGSNTVACVPSATVLCIDDTPGDRRFEVRLVYQGTDFSGEAKAIPLSSLGVNRGGLFWFFSADNPELLIKVLNGCGLTSSYWVFYSAGTNVGFSLTVRDTVTGKFKVYNNANGVAAVPVQDTGSTFACN